MRALLDENMPKALIRLLAPEVEARTVQQEGWSGRKNGDLLSAASASFDIFITTDRGIPHQQNLSRYSIGMCYWRCEAIVQKTLLPSCRR